MWGQYDSILPQSILRTCNLGSYKKSCTQLLNVLVAQTCSDFIDIYTLSLGHCMPQGLCMYMSAKPHADVLQHINTYIHIYTVYIHQITNLCTLLHTWLQTSSHWWKMHCIVGNAVINTSIAYQLNYQF